MVTALQQIVQHLMRYEDIGCGFDQVNVVRVNPSATTAAPLCNARKGRTRNCIPLNAFEVSSQLRAVFDAALTSEPRAK